MRERGLVPALQDDLIVEPRPVARSDDRLHLSHRPVPGQQRIALGHIGQRGLGFWDGRLAIVGVADPRAAPERHEGMVGVDVVFGGVGTDGLGRTKAAPAPTGTDAPLMPERGQDFQQSSMRAMMSSRARIAS